MAEKAKLKKERRDTYAERYLRDIRKAARSSTPGRSLTAMESYTELKARQAKELNDFEGIFFAFNNKQFKEGMEKIGLTIEDKNQIYSLGAGGYIRKDRSKTFSAMFKRHAEEKNNRKKEEKFLFESLTYELRNHEFCITYDPSDALNALGYNKDDIDPKILKNAMAEAMQ